MSARITLHSMESVPDDFRLIPRPLQHALGALQPRARIEAGTPARYAHRLLGADALQ